MIDLSKLSGSQSQVIELDWDAYFLEFQALHGGEPVLHQPTQRLLFRDGWMHSATDTRGPEWSPPSDPRQLNQLMVEYWSTRRQMISNKLTSLKNRLLSFKEEQRLRSAPLQRRVITRDENGRSVTSIQKLDLPLIETELAILDNLLHECNTQLAELNTTKEE